MSEFFTQKIEKIRKELELFQNKNSKVYAEKESSVFQSVLHPATEEEVRKIIMSSSTTTCALDPIPTQLLKENLDILLPVITKIINRSLSESKVPDSFKLAIILPLLKKDSLDPDVFKHYRPISNLPFLSKVLERVVAVRLDSHSHPNSEGKQSAYKKHHSTETALLKIQNDILLKIDNQECVLLLLLDLSAAFDTVDHTILLERLQTRFGITGAALKWVESYFENRRQQVLINDVKSDEVHLDCNVPQGSVLGPKFFLDYESPLGEIIRSHGVEAHFYADDTQLYLSFKPDKQEIAQGEALTKLQNCISDVRAWMAANFLKLNDDKTELLVLGTPQQLEKVSIESVTVGNCQIEPSPTVRNIGAHFDQHLKMNHQVSLTCKAAWLRLYQIGKIRPYLTESETRSIVHAYVTSKIDQNNSLLLGIADNQIARIQRVQNAAAKLIFRKKKFDHVTPLLRDLHWLPVQQRIFFKVVLLIFKALNDAAPSYLTDLLKLYSPRANLRSTHDPLTLSIPMTNLRTYGDRAFSVLGPRLWNDLPLHIRESDTTASFKRQLKTHLFKVAFE